MKVADVVRAAEALAPPALAEDWDNVGLLVGDRERRVTKLLACMDVTEPVLAEAVKAKAEMILAHHPVIFKPAARVTADDAPVVYEAIRRGIAIYSAHTNLDNAPGGTNDVLADAIGLEARRPLIALTRREQCKVVTFAPPEDVSRVAEAAFDAGAGRIGNYSHCAFAVHGLGSFFGLPGSSPAVGHAARDEVVEELRIEAICPRSRVGAVCEAITGAHSYETPAIDVYPLEDYPAGCGAGRIGTLARPVTIKTIVTKLRKATGSRCVRLASPASSRKADGTGKLVRCAAIFTGSGRSGWRAAAAAGATLYVTGEMGHHDATDAVADGLAVLCLGHGSSERIGIRSLARRVGELLGGKVKLVESTRDQDPYAAVK
jgi:dinuclear metal center YbgI/SA1388 family protein